MSFRFCGYLKVHMWALRSKTATSKTIQACCVAPTHLDLELGSVGAVLAAPQFESEQAVTPRGFDTPPSAGISARG